MGWLEGVLTGYADRHYKIQDEKRREAELAAQREQQVLSTLLASEYPDIRDYAAAGVLDLASPRRRSGGVAGWMGEIDKSPYLAMVQRTRAQIADDPEYARSQIELGKYGPPGTPSIPPTVGSVPNQPSAALPETSLVEGGTGTAPTPAPPPPAPPPGLSASFGPAGPTSNTGRPPASFAAGAASPGVPTGSPSGTSDLVYRGPFPAPPPEPIPGANPNDPGQRTPLQAGGPPTPPGVQAAQAEGAAPPQAGPPMAPAGPPQPPAGPPLPVSGPPAPPAGMVAAGMPGATVGQVGPGAPVRSSRTALPGIFPTPADLQRQQTRAGVTGKIDGYAEMYMAQGIPEQEAYRKAAELLERDLIGGTAATPFSNTRGEYPDPVTGEMIKTPIVFDRRYGTYTLPNGQPLPPGFQLVTGGTLGQSVETAAQEMGFRAGAKTVPPEMLPQVLERARQIDAQNITDRPISISGKSAAVRSFQTQWNGIQTPIRQMEVNLRNMAENYQAYMAGDETAWEALRTAFVHIAEPNSVVMPSEFARAAGVLGWKDAIWGYINKAQYGGAPLPKNEVMQMARAADAMWQGVATYGAQQRSAIEATLADPRYGIRPEEVFGDAPRFQPDWGTGGIGGPGPASVASPPPPRPASAAPPPSGGGASAPPAGIPQKGFYKDPVTGKRYLDGKEY